MQGVVLAQKAACRRLWQLLVAKLRVRGRVPLPAWGEAARLADGLSPPASSPCCRAVPPCAPGCPSARETEERGCVTVGQHPGWKSSCGRAPLPAPRAALSPAGSCHPAPRTAWEEGWFPRGPRRLPGALPACPGSLPGTAWGAQLATGAVPTCPLLHLPPARWHLLGSGRCSAPSPSGSLPVRGDSWWSVSSPGRGAVAACPHGGTRPGSGCPAALPVAV